MGLGLGEDRHSAGRSCWSGGGRVSSLAGPGQQEGALGSTCSTCSSWREYCMYLQVHPMRRGACGRQTTPQRREAGTARPGLRQVRLQGDAVMGSSQLTGGWKEGTTGHGGVRTRSPLKVPTEHSPDAPMAPMMPAMLFLALDFQLQLQLHLLHRRPPPTCCTGLPPQYPRPRSEYPRPSLLALLHCPRSRRFQGRPLRR